MSEEKAIGNGSADGPLETQGFRNAAEIAAILLSCLGKAGDNPVRLVADMDSPRMDSVIKIIEKTKESSAQRIFIERGISGHCLGQAAGLALALARDHVFCLMGTEETLSGSGLEAARFAAGQRIGNLTLMALDPRSPAIDPAVLYAALGWQAVESGLNQGGLSRALTGCRNSSVPSAVFICLPKEEMP